MVINLVLVDHPLHRLAVIPAVDDAEDSHPIVRAVSFRAQVGVAADGLEDDVLVGDDVKGDRKFHVLREAVELRLGEIRAVRGGVIHRERSPLEPAAPGDVRVGVSGGGAVRVSEDEILGTRVAFLSPAEHESSEKSLRAEVDRMIRERVLAVEILVGHFDEGRVSGDEQNFFPKASGGFRVLAGAVFRMKDEDQVACRKKCLGVLEDLLGIGPFRIAGGNDRHDVGPKSIDVASIHAPEDFFAAVM